MRILIAGLGAIGQRHARNLRRLYGDDLELLAFRQRRLLHVVTDSLACDPTRDVEQELEVTTYDDLGEALATRPTAVFVCTPSSQHLEIAQRAAAAGCHLFIEKPVSHTLDGVEVLKHTVTSAGLIAVVGCQWRYHPCVQWLRGQLESGAFGEVVSVGIDYSEYLPDWHPYEDYRRSYAARADLGGGVVLTQIHDYDLAWWLFGPPRSVVAVGGHLSHLEVDVEDTIDARLEGGRAPVRVRQTFAARPARRAITVVAARGTVVVDLLAACVTSGISEVPSIAFPGYARNQMFTDELKGFQAGLAGRSMFLASLDEGIAVLRVALAARTALETGREVQIS